MDRDDREFVVYPDALAALDRSGHRDAGDGTVEGKRARVSTSRSTKPVIGRRAPEGGHVPTRVGLLSEKELQQVVTARFEYPALLPGTGGCSNELAAAFRPYSAKGRALRYLAARVMLEAYTDQGLCFSIAGAHRGCGTTYVAANMAVVFSQLGLRTLVIDANLRRPRMQKVFNKPQHGGLAAVIAGESSIGSCVIPVTQFRSLDLLPAGRSARTKASVLGNGMLSDVLFSLRRTYDVVICDSPSPVGDGDDGCEVVAAMCGNTVTVFRKDRTDVSTARKLLDSLDAVGTKQIGSILCTD